MLNITKNTVVGPSMVDLMDNVVMGESKRALAKSYVRDSELFIDLVARAVSGIVSAVGGTEHARGTPAVRAKKSSFDKLAHH